MNSARSIVPFLSVSIWSIAAWGLVRVRVRLELRLWVQLRLMLR